MNEVVKDLGRLDILVCAAGVYGTLSRIEEIDEEEMDAVLSVNLKGTLWCLQSGLPLLRAQGGRAVMIGSVGGILAGPHYAASKGGIHSMVKWAARATAFDGVRVNGIAPGAVDTEMFSGQSYSGGYCPLGRLGTTTESRQWHASCVPKTRLT
jgi:3-oxoacyl-[acyl-carrier protein] reductase